MSESTSSDHRPGAIPWWSSVGPEPQPLPLAGLVAGVQAALSWARERVLVPHADHADASSHPDCLACRAQIVLGRLAASPGESAGEHGIQSEPAPEPVQIEWIELDPPRT